MKEKIMVKIDDSVWGKEDVTSSKGMKDENFPVGSFLIAPIHRPIVHHYYHFARVADDMVDNVSLTSEEKKARLVALREVLLGLREAPNRADAQSAAKLRQSLMARDLPLSLASDLITAFIMDAEKNRYQSWDELLHYCRYSANPVGRFLLALHHESEETLEASDALCTSLQIINHLQDVQSDLNKLDRCYVPLEWLNEEKVTLKDLTLARSKPGVRRVFDRMLAKVDGLNTKAKRLPSLIRDRRMRLEAAVIVNLCVQLTNHLHYNDPIEKRVALTRKDGVYALLKSIKYFSVSA
ncbi:squalene synthase HpnC [Aristophania vespae]|nr:squalene synthase HpnC [Aristophania vespae]